MRIIFFYMLLGVLTADGLMVFLTPVIVYQLTTSIEYAGLTYALWWLPRLFLIPLIGKYIDDLGVRPISIISDSCKIIGCLFLLLTYFTSDLMIAISFGLVGSLISIGNSQTLISYEKFIYIISSPILLFSIFIAIGNNMFDGLIESSGTALIDQAMSLPIKYYGFIDIVAGIFGVLGTYLYSYLNQYISRILLIIISISIITISSSLLVFFKAQ